MNPHSRESCLYALASTRSRTALRLVTCAVLLVLLATIGCATSSLHAPSPPTSTRPYPTVSRHVPGSDFAPQAITEERAKATPRAPFEDFAWPDDDVVRSAGRIRALSHEHAREQAGLQERGIEPAREQARLRAHFAFVLGWLEEHEEASLALAADRLADRQGRPASATQRSALVETLRHARRQQLAALREYARAGRFPQNPDIGGSTRPIFVDEADTACAVGHLMRVDGFESAVEAIRTANNHVFVPDVTEGPLLAWVDQSGLLLEEAAVIQPTYSAPPVPGNVDLSALATPGASVETNGLRLDQFSARRTTLGLPDGFTPELLESFFPLLTPREAIETLTQGLGIEPDETILGPTELANIGLTTGSYYTDDNGGVIEPFFDTAPIASPFLFWNGGAIGGFLSDPGMAVDLTTFEIGFDVSPVASGFGLDASYFSIQGGFWGDAPTYGPDLEIEVLLSTVGGELLASYSDKGGYDNGYGVSYASIDGFEAQEKIRVVVRGSQAFAAEPLVWSQFRQDFRIVPIPEPTASILVSLGLLALALTRRD